MQTFEENSTLEGLMKELIVPSVYRKEVLFREKALIGLGLCCLIARVGIGPMWQDTNMLTENRAENGTAFITVVSQAGYRGESATAHHDYSPSGYIRPADGSRASIPGEGFRTSKHLIIYCSGS
jgi:hypothetical protein